MSFDGEILAIDPATKTGAAWGAPGTTPHIETVNLGRDDIADSYGAAVAWMATKLRDRPPALVVIEKVVPPSSAWGHTNHATTMITIGLFGILCGIARCKSIPLLLAPINSWRKHSLGSGRLAGEQAKHRAVRLCRSLGWDAPDHNAAEAACIFIWASAQVAPERAPRIEPLFTRRAS